MSWLSSIVHPKVDVPPPPTKQGNVTLAVAAGIGAFFLTVFLLRKLTK